MLCEQFPIIRMASPAVAPSSPAQEKHYSLALTQIPRPVGSFGSFINPQVITDMIQRDSLTWRTNPRRVLTESFLKANPNIDLSKATVTWIPTERKECVIHFTGSIVTVMWENSMCQELAMHVTRPFTAATLAENKIISAEAAARVKHYQQNAQFQSDAGASADTVSVDPDCQPLSEERLFALTKGAIPPHDPMKQ
jgi:hypothetical protein